MSKYIITKANGKPVAKAARYFVLRVDYHGKLLMETLMARKALQYYADACAREIVACDSIKGPPSSLLRRSRAKLVKARAAALEVLNNTRVIEEEP